MTDSKYVAIVVMVLIVLAAAVFLLNAQRHWGTTKKTSTALTTGYTSTVGYTSTTGQQSSVTTTIYQPSGLTVLTYNETVPQKYASLYDSMQSQITVLNQTITQNPPPYIPHNTIYGLELINAEGDTGTKLLSPNAIKSVITELDIFQQMGIKEVTVSIPYPILLPSFPNSAGYLAFYENVSQQVHSRGMIMDVEATPALPGYGLNFSFAGLNYTTLAAGERQMIEIMVDDVHPDYIDVDAEPATAELATGIKYLDTPQGWDNYTALVFSNLSEGSTKVGIGVDSWESPDFIKVALNTSNVDFISTHVYPTGEPIPNNLVTLGNLARQHGKPIVIDEVGPYQTTNVTEPYGNLNNYYEQVGTYAFWIPVDIRFLNTIATYSKEYDVQIVSQDLESRLIFAYLNYNSTVANLNYEQTGLLEDQYTTESIHNGGLTPTGATYMQIINST